MELPIVRMVISCVLEREKLTMIHRVHKKTDIHYGTYIPPGGKIEKGELPYEAFVRETIEEVGLTPETYQELGNVFFDNEERLKPCGDPFTFNVDARLYLVARTSGDLKSHDDNGNDILEVHVNRIHDLPMHEGDRFLWDHILNKRSGRFEAYVRQKGYNLDKKATRLSFR